MILHFLLTQLKSFMIIFLCINQKNKMINESKYQKQFRRRDLCQKCTLLTAMHIVNSLQLKSMKEFWSIFIEEFKKHSIIAVNLIFIQLLIDQVIGLEFNRCLRKYVIVVV